MIPILTNKKAIIYDLDNTLVATDAYVQEHLLETIQLLGLPGVSSSLIAQVQKRNLPFEDLFKELFSDKAELVLSEYRKTAVSKPYFSTKGAADLVKKFQEQNLVQGVLTNRTKLAAERLGQAGFSSFAFILSPAPEFRKPHPQAFSPAIQWLNDHGIKLNEAITFGDHLDDYLSAKSAGIDFCALLTGQTTREEFVSAGLPENKIFEDMGQLGKIVSHELGVSDRESYFNALKNFNAAEGRHCLITAPLKDYFSEHALHKYRTLVELKHLIKMSEHPEFGLPALSEKDKSELMRIFDEFGPESSQAIAEYDHFGRKGIGPTEHDVKSVELFIAEKLKGTNLEYLVPWIHFGFTSEDVNNIAYNCMLQEGLNQVWLPELKELCSRLRELSVEHKKTPLLSKTHGQPASPTTFGKEMAVYLQRFTNEIQEIQRIKLSSKMNGAVGNYNAHKVSFPNFDWLRYSQEFVESFGFDVELLTNQRGPKNKIVQLFQSITRVNNILKDLDIDFWLYVSQNLVLQKKVSTHVGSSVMPHKINPWLIECSESNVEISNALFEVFSQELEISRLQRDLSDHDLERNYGTAFSYSLVALNYSTNFLGMIQINSDLMLRELNSNQQVLSEAYQTILRAKGKADAYTLFKDQFRSNTHLDQEKISQIIDGMDLDPETKSQLKSLKVEDYLGETEKLVEIAVRNYDQLDLN